MCKSPSVPFPLSTSLKGKGKGTTKDACKSFPEGDKGEENVSESKKYVVPLPSPSFPSGEGQGKDRGQLLRGREKPRSCRSPCPRPPRGEGEGEDKKYDLQSTVLCY